MRENSQKSPKFTKNYENSEILTKSHENIFANNGSEPPQSTMKQAQEILKTIFFFAELKTALNSISAYATISPLQ